MWFNITTTYPPTFYIVLTLDRIFSSSYNKMPHNQVDHRKRSQQFNRITNSDNDKPKNVKSDAKEYNLLVRSEDIVINYKLPSDGKLNANGKIMQKRKLSSEHYDWDWAPYPRKAKSQRHDVSLYESNGYLSDEFETSQIVPDWDVTEKGSSCLLSCVEDSLNIKATGIQIVIDEVIEFDNLKSPSENSLDEVPICFDIDKIFDIVGSDECDDLANNKQKNAVDVLLTLTNNSQLVMYEDNGKMLKEAMQAESCRPLLFDEEPSEAVDFQDQWQNDFQVEEFKFARCFKCRQKVLIGTKGFVSIHFLIIFSF